MYLKCVEIRPFTILFLNLYISNMRWKTWRDHAKLTEDSLYTRDATSLSSSVRLFMLDGTSFSRWLSVLAVGYFRRAYTLFLCRCSFGRQDVRVCSATWRMTNYVETAGLPGPGPGAWGTWHADRPSRGSLDGRGEFQLHGPPLVIRCRTKDASQW